MTEVIIGIDPDIEKNGVAVLYTKTQEISVHSLLLGQLLSYIDILKNKYNNTSIRVCVEAGWKNKGNYHLTHYDTKKSAAKKGVDQGRNHQRGIDIIEILRYNNLTVDEVRPLQLIWKKGKISHEEITRYLPIVKKKTNQEERDAALIAWVAADLPFVPQKYTYKC